jgi:hypothetical protein
VQGLVVVAAMVGVLGGSGANAVGDTSAPPKHVSPAAQDRAMLSVAPVLDGSTAGAPAAARRRLLAADRPHAPHLVVRLRFWTVDRSLDDADDQLGRTTPAGMSSDASDESSGSGNGTVEGTLWLLKTLPANLLTADLTVAVTRITADTTAVMAVAQSQRALPLRAFRVPASVRHIRLTERAGLPPKVVKRRAMRGDTAAALVRQINGLSAYPKNPDFTCASGPAPRRVATVTSPRHTWTIDAGSCAAIVTITRDTDAPRYFHPDSTLSADLKRDLDG